MKNFNVYKKASFLLILALGLGAPYYYFQTPKLRSYEPADYETLSKLISDNLYWVSENADFSGKDIFLKTHASGYTAPYAKTQVWVAQCGFTPCGFVSYLMAEPQKGKIWVLVVDQKYRGRGIGEKLMSNAIKDLKAQGAHLIFLVTRTLNHSALRLYEKLGFVRKNTSPWGIATLELIP